MDSAVMNVVLIMFKENGEQKGFAIGEGRTIVGRQDDCDLRIPLGEISRKHAVFMVDDKSVTIRDTGSANGTYVNNQRISEVTLKAGDHLVLGPVVFTVQINGEPAEIKPVKTTLSLTPRSKVAASPAGKTAAKPAAAAAAADEADLDALFGDDEDPISELEHLTGSSDTSAINTEDSFFSSSEDSKV